MLKKRIVICFLLILSLFASVIPVVSAEGGYTLPEAVLKRRLSIYMPSVKVPETEIKESNLTVKGSTSEAMKLFDENISTKPQGDEITVTLDVGKSILFSQLRYYTGAVPKDENNCLGTRFYASRDNRKFDEVYVAEDIRTSDIGWHDIEFSGFGEYRYFKVVIPENSNICEVEYYGTVGFSKEKTSQGKCNVSLTLCGYNEGNKIDTTILGSVFNSEGVMKHGQISEQSFPKNEATEFNVEFKDIPEASDDSYRIVVFDEKGSSPIPGPLVYRINDASSEFSVSPVFGNNMLLQADKPAVVWGKAPKEKTVDVILKNASGGEVKKTVKVDSDSKWEADLGSFSAGGKYTLLVRCDGKCIEYKNITFGDVWLCTGQSNMEFYMMAGEDSAKDIKEGAKVKNSNIRIYNLWNVGTEGAAKECDNPPLNGVLWREAAADTVSYCSAVGYYFADEIQRKTGVPVGIINVAVGDTEINRWVKQGTKRGKFTSTDGDLYNNRIVPFEKLNIKGVILYQGEADQYRTHMSSDEYSDAMSALVDGYRSVWGADLPFYWAQLTRYKSDESEIRQGQMDVLDKIAVKKNTGVISLLDIFGNYNGGTGSCRDDIHPWNKKTVAERFAKLAMRDCYGEKNSYATGPVFKSSAVDGEKLVLTFDCNGALRLLPKERYADKTGLEKIASQKLDVNKPHEFEIAGEDKNFVPADAMIEGNKVILSAKGKVTKPVYARYAWGAYPEMPNLTDDSGLPSYAFTTEK